MELQWHQINQAFLKKVLAWALMGVLGGWLLPAVPALAAEPPAIHRPAPPPAAEEKKEEAPTTCGPLLSDTCIPLEAHKVSMSATFAYSFYPGLFDRNWKYASAGGNFGTYYMPVRLTVGVAKNWESYVIAPFIINTASSVERSRPRWANLCHLYRDRRHQLVQQIPAATGNRRPGRRSAGCSVSGSPPVMPRISTPDFWVRMPSAPAPLRLLPASTSTSG